MKIYFLFYYEHDESTASVYSTGVLPHMRYTFTSYEVAVQFSKIAIPGINST